MIKQLIEKIKGLFAQPTPAAPVEFIEPTIQAPVAEPQAAPAPVAAPAPAPVEKKPKTPRKRKPAAKKPAAK